jgi:hypothetical protein
VVGPLFVVALFYLNVLAKKKKRKGSKTKKKGNMSLKQITKLIKYRYTPKYVSQVQVFNQTLPGGGAHMIEIHLVDMRHFLIRLPY